MTKQSTTMPKSRYSLINNGSSLRSITNQELDETRKYCSSLVEEKYDGDYESRTLRSMMGTIKGSFDLLKSKLTDDYNRMLNKLKRRQNRKIKKVARMITNFEPIVESHEVALKRYSENIAAFTDRRIDNNLSYSDADLQELKTRLNKIEEKNHEA